MKTLPESTNGAGGSSGGPGRERAEFTVPRRGAAVAATNDPSAGAMSNRRVTACIREFGARGRAAHMVRAATSVRRVGVKHRCARGLPRVVGGREGDRVHTGARGRRVLLVAARNLATR